MKVISIVKREYIARVKTKGFLVGTLLLPVMMIAFLLMPGFFMSKSNDDIKKITIIDQTNRLKEPVESFFQDITFDDGKQKYDIEMLNPQGDIDVIKTELNNKVNKGALDAYLLIPSDVFTNNKFEMYLKNVANIEMISRMERNISGIIRNIRLTESGLDPDLINKLGKRVNVTTFKIETEGSKEQRAEFTYILTIFMGLILYMMLLLYGQFVVRSIIEDKNSRVIEVLISSVRPWQFMAGKVIGIGATGLTQFLIWAVSFLLISTYGLVMAQVFVPEITQLHLPNVSAFVLTCFCIFFILGYFLYATIGAAIGSMVNTDSEAQSYQWIMMFPIIISFFLMFYINNQPDSFVSVVLSFIPFFTPLLMFARILNEAVPLWQIGLSMLILILSVWGMLWICGRIFRIGILMYGKKPDLPQVLKWIKYQ